MQITLLICGVLFALLAYSVYEPMPDYVLDRGFLTLGHSVWRIFDAVGDLTEYFGICESEVVRRQVFSQILPPPKNSSRVLFTYEQFADSRTLVARPLKPSGAALIYIHGGGWAVGSPEMFSETYEELADKTGITVFAVRYRLAPEQPFPAAFDDCLSATLAIFDAAKSLGLDAGRIAIAGDSAGGQLTASVVQQLRRSGSPHRPKLHLMVYPVTQVVNLRTSSHRSHSNVALMKHLPSSRFLSLYLAGDMSAADWISQLGHATEYARLAYERATGEPFPKSPNVAADSAVISESVASRVATLATDPRVSPLLAADLDQLDLPPVHILACKFDRLYDDAIMYAKRLQRAGVRTHLSEHQTYHGALNMANDGQEMRNYLVKVFRDLL